MQLLFIFFNGLYWLRRIILEKIIFPNLICKQRWKKSFKQQHFPITNSSIFKTVENIILLKDFEWFSTRFFQKSEFWKSKNCAMRYCIFYSFEDRRVFHFEILFFLKYRSNFHIFKKINCHINEHNSSELFFLKLKSFRANLIVYIIG